jgi:hypothetical protein
MRLYVYLQRMNEERIPMRVLKTKVKGKLLRGRPRSRWEHLARNDVTQREGRPWEEI